MTCCLDAGLEPGRADLIDDSATESLPWEKTIYSCMSKQH